MYKKTALIIIIGFSFSAIAQQKATKITTNNIVPNNFILGESIKGEHDSYNIVKNAFALHNSSQNTTQNTSNKLKAQSSSSSSSSTSSLLVKKGGFSFYKGSNSQVQQSTSAKSQQSQPLSTSFTVVLNHRTGTLGILTGSILIKLNDFRDADSLIQNYNLTETSRFGGLLKLVIVKTEVAKLNSLLTQISADPRVERAEPEILENFNEPK